MKSFTSFNKNQTIILAVVVTLILAVIAFGAGIAEGISASDYSSNSSSSHKRDDRNDSEKSDRNEEREEERKVNTNNTSITNSVSMQQIEEAAEYNAYYYAEAFAYQYATTYEELEVYYEIFFDALYEYLVWNFNKYGLPEGAENNIVDIDNNLDEDKLIEITEKYMNDYLYSDSFSDGSGYYEYIGSDGTVYTIPEEGFSYDNSNMSCYKCYNKGYYTCHSCNGKGTKTETISVPNYGGGYTPPTKYTTDCPDCTDGTVRCYCGR